MKQIHFLLVTFLSLISFCSCHQSESRRQVGETTTPDSSVVVLAQPRYAKGYKVKYQNGLTLIDICDPQGGSKTEYHFALQPKGEETDETVPSGYTLIKTPVKNLVCMTALQLSNFICLERRDVVRGISSTKHLYDEQIKSQIKDGVTHKIGIEGNFDDEVVMGLGTEVILVSLFKRGGYESLKECGIPLVPHMGYKELTPLGQAEWIKLVGLMIDEESRADSLFSAIEERYNNLVKLTTNVKERPTVMSGEQKNGHWYAPGGRSFLAKIFADAGADYFLKDNPDSGGVTMDFEAVYAKAAHVDYWRILNTYEGKYSYEVLGNEDSRHKDFKAYKDKGIIYCSLNEGPYYELMPVQPDIILADFIYAFHPSLIPDYKPKFYHLLK